MKILITGLLHINAHTRDSRTARHPPHTARCAPIAALGHGRRLMPAPVLAHAAYDRTTACTFAARINENLLSSPSASGVGVMHGR